MSTYTDCHIRVRENLTIQRCPGNPCDGITQQRVIFENPENQYYGTFIGNVSAGQMELSTATIADATIAGGQISCSSLDMQDGIVSNAKIVQPVIEINVNGMLVDLSRFLEQISALLSACPCKDKDSGSSDDDDDGSGSSCPLNFNDGVCG